MTWESNCISGPFVYIGCSLVLEVISFASRNTGKLAVTANMAIAAAARLGLDCATIGHVDDDIVDSSFASYETLLCCGGGRNVATLDKVTELMRASDITEDDEFWSELVRDLDAEEITILSKMVINGRNIQANHIALQKVVSELLLP
ncbi:hypothetical protein DKX38_002088 [Salix brachista]|uniref:Uncharacterized protein n=1 Tax=Salix brachista TaxID=2182728 RepID=A0A5N5NL26_9ROSI|nr:hypothetical protein DKX38_002088 [Salix brachista]